MSFDLIVQLIDEHKERHMADFTKLQADIAELKALITTLIETPAPVPVDEQPAVDAADAEVTAITAMLKPAEAPAA